MSGLLVKDKYWKVKKYMHIDIERRYRKKKKDTDVLLNVTVCLD